MKLLKDAGVMDLGAQVGQICVCLPGLPVYFISQCFSV